MADDAQNPDERSESDERPAKKRKKRRRKRKRSSVEQSPPATEPASGKPPRGESKRGRWIWLALLLIGVFELWMFGRRGHVEVCVAKEGVHDFGLLGDKRTDANTRQYPTCEKRYNLGLTSSYDDVVEEAMLRACHRANILRGKEATLICAIKESGWQHRITQSHCPPWHDHYYQRLFWFVF